ncbi:MAG: GNAT family N-acetyltransferase [Polymorphobacter sp.]|uniref:GNAT family N-acetyltransferase n=1 Tax=Polymorphobacter sp. TaxID=1909290 RepID=UPI003A85370A
MISYRDATPDDGPMLGGLARATFLETFGHLYKLPDLEAFLAQGSDQAYAAELAQSDIEVRFAMAGPVPIGFCKLSNLTLPAEPEGPAIELRQLYIFKLWHGEGIAEQFMAWAFARAAARGASEMWLSVFTDNHRARRFYARHGFEEIRPYAFMVGTQSDEDILARRRL